MKNRSTYAPDLDRFDIAIVEALAGDGRMAVTELARRIGLSKTPTQARVKRLEETGVMLTPGSAMEMEGWLRIGYANSPSILQEGLALLGGFLAKLDAERGQAPGFTT